jgi:hypothetical protein
MRDGFRGACFSPTAAGAKPVFESEFRATLANNAFPMIGALFLTGLQCILFEAYPGRRAISHQLALPSPRLSYFCPFRAKIPHSALGPLWLHCFRFELIAHGNGSIVGLAART